MKARSLALGVALSTLAATSPLAQIAAGAEGDPLTDAARFLLGELDAQAGERGYLGVHLGDGASIAEVVPNSPAAEAGLEVGDRILAVGDRRVSGTDELLRWMASFDAGTEVRLLVERAGWRRTFAIELKRRSELEVRADADGLRALRAEIERLRAELAELEAKLREAQQGAGAK